MIVTAASEVSFQRAYRRSQHPHGGGARRCAGSHPLLTERDGRRGHPALPSEPDPSLGTLHKCALSLPPHTRFVLSLSLLTGTREALHGSRAPAGPSQAR